MNSKGLTYKGIIKTLTRLSVAGAGLLFLPACSSDSDPVISQEPAHEATPVVLSLSFGTGETRTGTETPADAQIHSICAYLIDNSNKIVAAGFTSTDITESTQGATPTYNAKIAMFPSANVASNTNYKLRVFANIPQLHGIAVGAAMLKSNVSDWLYTYALEGDAPCLPSDWMPMSANSETTITISNVKDHGTKETAFPVTGTISLTRLLARLDFVYYEDENKVKNTDFTYPIQYLKTDNNGTTTATDGLQVKFTKADVCNIANKINLYQKESSDVITTPQTGSTGFSFLSDKTVDVKEGTALYVAEYFPTYTSANFTNTTYLKLTGILQVNPESHPELSDDVVKTLNGTDASHPALYYYDDGTIQTTLTKKDHSSDENWKKIEYSDTYSGYPVTYRVALRHSANATQGTVEEMEYGLARNTIYEISIKSVLALPRTETDDLESNKDEINIQIIAPKKWTYHRGAFETSFE